MNYTRKRYVALCLLLFTFSTFLTAQEIKNSGYILFDNGNQESVIFEEKDLLNNPTQILYRRSVDGELLTGNLNDIQEFWIPGSYKYTKKTVDIDRSGDKSSNITTSRSPVFNSETLFLQVLIEGENSLYMYREGDLVRFFYSLDGGDINQFVYKVYLAKVSVMGRMEDKPRLNETYKQQVVNELKCDDIDVKTAQKLQYRKRDFMRVFKTYNKCLGSPYVEWKGQKSTSFRFNAKLRTGIRSTVPDFNGSTTVRITNAIRLPVTQGARGQRVNDFFIASEFELLIPGLKTGVSSVFLELNYFNIETDLTGVEGQLYDMSLDFNILSAYGGLRYYYPVSKQLSPFFDFSIGYSTILNTSTAVRTNRGTGEFEEVSFPPEARFGAGLDINRKINVLARYGTVFSTQQSTIAFTYASLSLSYSFF